MQICSSNVEVRERYDPVFILNFSIHSLSKGYVEPVEFAGLGLLAIAFVSMSSTDLGIRRLAYETLDRLKNALEVGNIILSWYCLWLKKAINAYLLMDFFGGYFIVPLQYAVIFLFWRLFVDQLLKWFYRSAKRERR